MGSRFLDPRGIERWFYALEEEVLGEGHVEVETQVETVDRTGVEMEAMTACSIAALTIYDMCKSADRSMLIGDLALWEKTGGRSGHWRRPAEALVAPPVNSAASPVVDLDARIEGLIGDGTADPLI